MGLKRLLATPRRAIWRGIVERTKDGARWGWGALGGRGGQARSRRATAGRTRLPAHPGCRSRSRSRPGPPLWSRDLGYRFLGGDG